MPGSIHLAAAHGAERTLLELAYEIEAVNPLPCITSAKPRAHHKQ